MQTVLIIGANGKVSIEATKLFLEDSNYVSIYFKKCASNS